MMSLPTPSDWGSAGGGEPSAKFLAEPSPHMPNFDQILPRAPPRQVRKGADAGIHVQSQHATAASASSGRRLRTSSSCWSSTKD